MNSSGRTIIITLSATFILMSLLVVYTARVIFRTSYKDIAELGNDKTSAITADLENYLENAKSVLWVAADTVDHMVAKGASYEEIVEYITVNPPIPSSSLTPATPVSTVLSATSMWTVWGGPRLPDTITPRGTGTRLPLLPRGNWSSYRLMWMPRRATLSYP